VYPERDQHVRHKKLQWHGWVHLIGLAPLAWLGLGFARGLYAINPLQAAIQRTGDAAILLLTASLACTPLWRWARWRAALSWRRPLGLYAFFYAAAHLFLYAVVDYGLNWGWLLQEVSEKRFLWFGLPAFFILALLALTSLRTLQRRLGGTWKTVHRLVYLAAVLASLHFALAVKGSVFRLQGDIWKPLAVAIVLGGLLGARVVWAWRERKKRHRAREMRLSAGATEQRSAH